MPTVILTPIGPGAHGDLAITGGATYAAVLGDVDDATFIYADSINTGKGSVVMSALPAGVLRPYRVDMRWRGLEALADVHNVTPFISDGVTELAGAAVDLGLVATPYTATFLTAPDGTPWSVADLAALQVGINMVTPTQEQRWTLVDVLVYYSAAPAQLLNVS